MSGPTGATAPAAKVRYLVLKNARWDSYAETEAHNAKAAATAVGGEDEGTYTVVPIRYTTVIEIGPPETPPVPQMEVTDRDTAEWLAAVQRDVQAEQHDEATTTVWPTPVGEPV